MSTKIDIDPDTNLVTVTVNGAWGVDKALVTFDKFISAPDFQSGMNLLVDLREATIAPSPGDAQQLATHVRMRQAQRGSDYKLAVLVMEGIERVVVDIYLALIKAFPMEGRIFEDPNEAYEWLGQ